MPTPRRRFCCDDDLAFLGNDGLSAEQDLERWRRGDLNLATQELIRIIRAEGVEGAALLTSALASAQCT